MAEQTFNIKFVEEVEKYPCLYNYTLGEYSRKDITEKAWIAIGKELNLTGSECKEKWKNLRTVFVRHMKPAPSGSSAKVKKPYYLTTAMQFALPYIKTLNTVTSGNLPRPSEEVHDTQEDENMGIIDPQTALSPIPSPESVSLPSPSPQSNSLPVLSPQSNSLPPESAQSSVHQKTSLSKVKSNKRSKDNIDETFDEYLKAKKSQLEASMNPLQQANKMFLLSLLPDMNEMSPQQIRFFKRKVLDLIDSILQNTPQILSTGSSFAAETPVSAGYQSNYSPINTQANTLTFLGTEPNPQTATQANPLTLLGREPNPQTATQANPLTLLGREPNPQTATQTNTLTLLGTEPNPQRVSSYYEYMAKLYTNTDNGKV